MPPFSSRKSNSRGVAPATPLRFDGSFSSRLHRPHAGRIVDAFAASFEHRIVAPRPQRRRQFRDRAAEAEAGADTRSASPRGSPASTSCPDPPDRRYGTIPGGRNNVFLPGLDAIVAAGVGSREQ